MSTFFICLKRKFSFSVFVNVIKSLVLRLLKLAEHWEPSKDVFRGNCKDEITFYEDFELFEARRSAQMKLKRIPAYEKGKVHKFP